MDDLADIRRHLHQHPELSSQERATQQYLLDLLGRLPTDGVEPVADTGILVHFKGRAAGRTILFRCELDALPIQEASEAVHPSTNAGVSHACGHDGHATIMYGLSRQFADERPARGDVHIVFQPAEEPGRGAPAVIDSSVLDKLQPELVFALHNVPGYPLGEVVCREGSFTASVTTLIAYFTGHTSHAAEPWNGRNPAAAMSRYLLEAVGRNLGRPDEHEFLTITPVHMELGEMAYGTSAGAGSVHLTLRAECTARLREAVGELQELAERLADDEGLSIRFEERERFESNRNAPEAVTLIRTAARELGMPCREKDGPFRWGEDFGLFTHRVPGAMFGLGAGESCPSLHHPAYDFPDALIAPAIRILTAIQRLAQPA